MNFLYTIQPFHAPNFIGRMSPVEKEIPRWIVIETIEKKSPSSHSMGDQYSLVIFWKIVTSALSLQRSKNIGRA